MGRRDLTFRVFVSSTFTDLIAERSALQRSVFPRLREYCQHKGARFQAIDLRWGVSEEAALDQQTMNICLQELQRCQKVSPRPNFIVLLGDRYGWRPLPPQIELMEFRALWTKVSQDQRRFLLQWYKRDKNADPPEYCLQPRHVDVHDDQTEHEEQMAREAEAREWGEQIEPRLRELLVNAARLVFPASDDPRRQKYEDSATHQEICRGALQAEGASDHVFCYFRHFEQLLQCRKSEGGPFVDLRLNGTLDEESHDRLQRLKSELESTFAPFGHIHHYSVPHPGAVKWKRLRAFCRQVEQDLRGIIDSELDSFKQGSQLDREIEAHKEFGQQRMEHFIGRQGILAKIQTYIIGDSNRPFVVHGKSGSGKTALMARAEALIAEIQEPGSERTIISRFVGATPDSSNIRSLLESLCRQIALSFRDEQPVPSDYRELIQDFAKRLTLATAERPVVVLLDALDQLSQTDGAHYLSWLPRELPVHVKLIVSVLEADEAEGACHRIARNLAPAENLARVNALPAREGEELLDIWLDRAHRRLQPAQRQEILNKFARDGLPLYLKLAFGEARRWKSYDPLTPLSADVPGVVRNLLARLEDERNHGRVLTRKALGYLGAGRHGLTEEELLDVLSADEEVLAAFVKRSPGSPATDRLPVVVWSRLRADLDSYLTERTGDDTPLLVFYHRQLGGAVRQQYLSGADKAPFHRQLAHYFSCQPHELGEPGNRHSNLRQMSELPYHLMHARQWRELVELISHMQFIESYRQAKALDNLLAELSEARALIGREPNPDLDRDQESRSFYWSIRFMLEAVVLQDTLSKIGTKLLPEIAALRGLPTPRIRAVLIQRLENLCEPETTDVEVQEVFSLLTEFAQGDDELLQTGCYHLASRRTDLAWKLARQIKDEWRRTVALGFSARRAQSLSAKDIFEEAQRLTSDEYWRAILLVNGIKHLVGMGGKEFRRLNSDTFKGYEEVYPLIAYYRALPEYALDDRKETIMGIRFLAIAHSMSYAIADFLRTTLILSRDMPEGFRLYLLEDAEHTATKVDYEDDGGFNSWARFDIAIEWAEQDVERAVANVLEMNFINPAAAAMAVIAEHCIRHGNHTAAVVLLKWVALMLPECTARVLPPDEWPFSCPEFSQKDMTLSRDHHSHTRAYVLALAYGGFAEILAARRTPLIARLLDVLRLKPDPVARELSELVPQLRENVRDRFKADWAQRLSPKDWRTLAYAVLTHRPDEAAAVVPTEDFTSVSDLPGCLKKQFKESEIEVLKASEIKGVEITFSQAWRESRVVIKGRLETVAPSHPDTRKKTDAKQVGEEPSLSNSETWRLIESLPEIEPNIPFSGRGWRDDYMAEQMQPIFRAWRNMELCDVETQVDRVASMIHTLFTGKRVEYPWWLTEAAAEVDADLGIRTMKRVMPLADYNAERVYVSRIRACGLEKIEEAVLLLEKLSGNRYLEQVITHLLSLLPRASPVSDALIHQAVQESLSRMSSGWELNAAIAQIADAAQELDAGRAYDLIAATFQTVERIKVELGTEAWQALLAVGLDVSSAANLAFILSAYSGPIEVLLSLREYLDDHSREELTSAIADAFATGTANANNSIGTGTGGATNQDLLNGY